MRKEKRKLQTNSPGNMSHSFGVWTAFPYLLSLHTQLSSLHWRVLRGNNDNSTRDPSPLSNPSFLAILFFSFFSYVISISFWVLDSMCLEGVINSESTEEIGKRVSTRRRILEGKRTMRGKIEGGLTWKMENAIFPQSSTILATSKQPVIFPEEIQGQGRVC